MRSYKVEAVVVKRRNFLEKDRILVLFSKEEGKISVLAKGARRPGAKLSFFSDIGFIGIFHLHPAKSLDIVIEIIPIFTPEGARGEFEKTEKLGFLFKLIDHLYHEKDPRQKTYSILKKTVIGVSEANQQMLSLVFLLHLIEDLGLKPELINCLYCRKKVKGDEKIVFSPRGGIAHKNCIQGESLKIERNEVKLMRLILESPFEKITKARVDRKIFEKVYRVTAAYLEWNFGKVLPEKIL